MTRQTPLAKRPLDTPRALERRRHLLEVGFEHFAERDFDEVQLDDVARDAGVSHGLIFQHFGNKKGFALAVLQQTLEEFRVRTTPDELLPVEQRLTAALRAYIDWAAEHPRGFASLMNGMGDFREIREAVEASRWEGIERIARAAEVDPRDPRVRVALRGWVGFTESALGEWLSHVETVSEPELIEFMLRALLAVLAGARANVTG